MTAVGCATGRASHSTMYVAARSRTEAPLTYMAPVVLAAKFSLDGGVR